MPHYRVLIVNFSTPEQNGMIRTALSYGAKTGEMSLITTDDIKIEEAGRLRASLVVVPDNSRVARDARLLKALGDHALVLPKNIKAEEEVTKALAEARISW